MDQIAAGAGVSKLTVYSHYGDKETLFAAVVRSYCEQQLPASLFAPQPGVALRERLLHVARAFFAMISSTAPVAGHTTLCAPRWNDSPLQNMLWEAAPPAAQQNLPALLRPPTPR